MSRNWYDVAVSGPCTTCDADCDMWTFQVPSRLCEPGEKPTPGSGIISCGVPSLGSGRIRFVYK